MHTHMFNALKPGISRESATLLAVQNTQADLHAGFTAVRDMSTHGNAYGDVDIRDAINRGEIDGPRAQVSTRGIVWGAPGAKPLPPGESAVVHNEEEARAAVGIRSPMAQTGLSCFQQGLIPSERMARLHTS